MSFFPERAPLSPLSRSLVKAHGWSCFLVPGLSESMQVETLAALLGGDARYSNLAMRRRVADTGGAQSFREDFENFRATHGRLKRHTARTTHENLRVYVERMAGLLETYRGTPSYGLHEILDEHCGRHIARILEDLQRGDYNDDLTGSMLEDLGGKLRRNLADGLARMGSAGLHEEDESRNHEPFVRKFGKEFKIEVHHWEPLADGVNIYLDQWNHEKMAGALPDLNTTLERVAEQCGYLMLRRGSQADIDFGTFPEPTSRWLFVKATTTGGDATGGIEVVSKTKYAPIPLKNE